MEQIGSRPLITAIAICLSLQGSTCFLGASNILRRGSGLITSGCQRLHHVCSLPHSSSSAPRSSTVKIMRLLIASLLGLAVGSAAQSCPYTDKLEKKSACPYAERAISDNTERTVKPRLATAHGKLGVMLVCTCSRNGRTI
jgi:hypothetical protein